jgi:arylsulfatase B
VTALVGKWHLGGTAAHHPQRRGFNEFFGFLHEGHYYTPAPWSGVTTWLRRKALPDGGQGRWTSADGQVIWSTHLGTNEPDYDVDNPLLRSTNPVAENNHLTDAFAREACDFIGRHAAQPFFLYLAFNAVHSPLQAANRYLERFAHIPDIHRRIFAAQLAHLDESVGQVMAALQQHGLAEDTLVAFISDNGGPTAELTSSNAPLRGGKGSLFEGGIRVPFIVRWPHRLPAGTVSAVPVTTLDLTPTLLMAAGVDRSSWQTDGGPLNEILAAPNGDRSLFWRMSPRAAVRRGGWKLVREGANGNAGEWQLYDLVNDPSESSNLATVETARVKDLAAAWEAWNRVQRTSNW